MVRLLSLHTVIVEIIFDNPHTHEGHFGDLKGPQRNRQAILHTADPMSNKPPHGLPAAGDTLPGEATSETKLFIE